MPARNGTGPLGYGPGTGAGFGNCTGSALPGAGRFGRAGQRRAFGRGFRRRAYSTELDATLCPTFNKNEEAQIIRSQITSFEQQLASLNKRLRDLEDTSE